MTLTYKEAENLLETGKIKECIDYFRDGHYTLEYAYALVLSGDLDNAEFVIKDMVSTRADWLRKLIPIMKGFLKTCPSYFQIRNFLEIDIDMLFKSKQTKFIQQIINSADILQSINNETYKFLARVLLKNNLPEGCKLFLDKSLDSFYNDVELHFLYVEYYMFLGDYENAKKSADNCLKINSEYYPAKKIKALLK